MARAPGKESHPRARVLREWVEYGEVQPLFTWSARDPAYDSHGGIGIRLFHNHSLFGALAIQLMLAISRTEGLAVCSSCATPYIPRRRPRAGERHYCSRCGRSAAQRDASKDYYQRKKQRPRHN